MPDLSDGVNWSEIDANNNNAPPNGWPEGMMPSGVNDAARADRGAMKRFWDKLNPVQLITPSGGIYTFTTANLVYPTDYVEGEVYCFRSTTASAGGDQFQVNALPPKPIWKRFVPGATGLGPIIALDIVNHGSTQLVYDANQNAGAGAFVLINPYVPIGGDGAGGVSIPGGLTVSTGLRVNADIMLGSAATAYGSVVRPNTAGINNMAFSAFGGATLNDVLVITNTMEVTGLLGTTGYRSRSGLSGPSQTAAFNIQWNGSAAHLWIDAIDIGPIVTGSAGSVVIGGNVSAGSVTASGGISAGGNITASGGISAGGDITATGNFHQNGNYHYFAGSSGTVNATGGPLIYGDANAIILKPGNGTTGVTVQNYAGTQLFQVDNSGNTSATGSITGGWITASGQLSSRGSSAGVDFEDRGNSSLSWVWLATGGTARLSNGADRLTINASGNLTANNVNASSTLTGVALQVNGDATVTGRATLMNTDFGALGSRTGYFDGSTGNFWAYGTAAIAGNIITSGNVTVGDAGFPTLALSGGFVALHAADAPAVLQACFLVGNGSDPTNYSRNTFHKFDNRTASFTYAFFNAGSPYCYKPGGGTWGDTSDIRIKRQIKDYTSGLAEIARLRPVRFQFNGKGGTTDDGQVFTGLVADEVRDVMPEMVGAMPAKLNPGDAHDTELLTLDATPLIYALVNSVKELGERVQKLETR